MMDIHAFLKAGTAALHARVERTPLSGRVLAPDVSLDDYAAFLAATWRVLAPLAERLGRSGGDHGGGHRNVGADLAPLVAAIEGDLEALGAVRGEPVGIGAAAFGPSVAARLGALYVAEGSAMGGAVIAAHLRRRLGEPAVAASRYLGRARLDAGARWRAWQEAAACAWTAADRDAALAAAVAVFAAFEQAYGGPSDRGLDEAAD